jgi:hypothetical protein
MIMILRYDIRGQENARAAHGAATAGDQGRIESELASVIASIERPSAPR